MSKHIPPCEVIVIARPLVFGDCKFENQALKDVKHLHGNDVLAKRGIKSITEVYEILADEYLKDTTVKHLEKYKRYRLASDLNI